MNLGKIIKYGLTGIVLSTLIGCDSSPKEKKIPNPVPEPYIVKGEVMAERFTDGLFDDYYYFSVNSNEKIDKLCVMLSEARIADSILDKGDDVNIRIPRKYGYGDNSGKIYFAGRGKDRNGVITIDLKDIKDINGLPIR